MARGNSEVHLTSYLSNLQNQRTMKFTYYGHACFGVDVNKKLLLFDPFISSNRVAKNIDISQINRNVNFYYAYAGDIALTLDIQLIPQYGDMRFAGLSIGDNFTVGFEDALQIARRMKTPTAIGVHYNTFDQIKIDTAKAQKHFSDNCLQLLLPEIGETIEV